MGIITSIKVVRLALGLCLLLVPESSPSLCPHRRQYWHEQQEKCVNCTACQAGQIVIRPCQVHRDAQCGPISELNIDWSFLSRRAHKHQQDNLDLEDITQHHHGSEHKHSKHGNKNHRHGVHMGLHKHHRKSHHQNQELNLFEHEKHKLNAKAHHAHHAHHAIKPESFQLSSDYPREIGESSAKLALLPESAALRSTVVPLMIHATPVPFSAVEKLVWDWQAVVLVLAVFACLLFFIVTGIYSIYHARHWRQFKDSFESDIEEASARRSLMVPGYCEPHAALPPLEPYAPSQGLCMDQLLDRKKQEDLGTPKGNFYIVRDKSGDPQEDSN